MPIIRKELPPAAYLRHRFSYDPDTGNLCPKSGRYAGHVLRKVNSDGYLQMNIDGVLFLIHRVIWKIVTGEEPPDHIDHRDMEKTNSRWENLREATHSQNLANRGLQRNNTSGFRGVRFRRGKFTAVLGKDGKRQHLGDFDRPEDAAAVYDRAYRAAFGGFAR